MFEIHEIPINMILSSIEREKIRRETFRWNCISFMLAKSCKYEMQRIRNHLKWVPGPRTQNLSSIYLLYETKGYESRNSIRAGRCVAVINWKKVEFKVWLFSRLYLCIWGSGCYCLFYRFTDATWNFPGFLFHSITKEVTLKQKYSFNE